MKKYDSFIIGTGQASGTLVGGLIELGQSFAVAEGGTVGGTCANFGCTPTKALVASAKAIHTARATGDQYGFDLSGDVQTDFQRVMARMNEIRGAAGLKTYIEDNGDFYPEYAQFEDEHRVRVGDEIIEAERIYINTGARARQLNLPGIEAIDVLDNKKVLELTELPEHLIIMGGSYIGMEFGQIFRRFGSQVTILERGGQLMSREDEDVAEIAQQVFAEEGIDVKLNTDVKQAGKSSSGGVIITYEQDGQQKTVEGSHLLVAVGRVPNADRLNLEAVGVETDDRGYIQVDNHLQTNIANIYALGDVNGEGAFTHTSVNDGEIILNNLNGGDRGVSDRIMTYGMFIDPPLGRVGFNEKQALESDRRLKMATMPMSDIARAREKGETDGIVKVLVDDDTDEFCGATVFGTSGDEVVNMFTVAMYSGVPCYTFSNAVFIHPTVSELMPYVIRNLEPLNY